MQIKPMIFSLYVQLKVNEKLILLFHFYSVASISGLILV